MGHDNWVRALVFHPNGKFLLSASDDKTVRIWELATGRCSKTIEAHAHFVTCMSWGRTTIAGPAQNGATSTIGQDGQAQVQMQMQATQPERRLVNVLATGSVDQVGLVRMWRATPLRLESWLMVGRLLDHQDLASVIAPHLYACASALALLLRLGQPLGAKHRGIENFSHALQAVPSFFLCRAPSQGMFYTSRPSSLPYIRSRSIRCYWCCA
jgi:hypothetical protein